MSQFLFVKPKALTKPDQLRELLTRLEALVGQLGHGLGAEALDIPPLFDQISDMLAELRAGGKKNVPAETSRYEHASSELQRKASIFLREVGGTQALQSARSSRQPDAAQWWWFLDQLVANKYRALLRRWLVGSAIGVALVAILFFGYQQFLAPDPAIAASFRHQQAAESLAQAGDWAGALREVEQALAATPDDPDLLIQKGILHQVLGQRADADDAFAEAGAYFETREDFLIARAGQFLYLNQNPAALMDLQELNAIDPSSAMGHLLIGQAYTNLENYTEAVAAFQRAGDLADSQGDSELAATARIRLGMVMRMMSPPTTTGIP